MYRLAELDISLGVVVSELAPEIDQDEILSGEPKSTFAPANYRDLEMAVFGAA